MRYLISFSWTFVFYLSLSVLNAYLYSCLHTNGSCAVWSAHALIFALLYEFWNDKDFWKKKLSKDVSGPTHRLNVKSAVTLRVCWTNWTSAYWDTVYRIISVINSFPQLMYISLLLYYNYFFSNPSFSGIERHDCVHTHSICIVSLQVLNVIRMYHILKLCI